MYERTETVDGVELYNVMIKRNSAFGSFAWSVYQYDVEETGIRNISALPTGYNLQQSAKARKSYYTNTDAGLRVQRFMVFPTDLEGNGVSVTSSEPFYEKVTIVGLPYALFNGEWDRVGGPASALTVRADPPPAPP